jgi:hypothetical protein
VAQIDQTLATFLKPITSRMPDKRLAGTVELAIKGIMGGQSPVITNIARGVARDKKSVWPMAKRLYGLLSNDRIGHRDFLKGLYQIGQQAVAHYEPTHLVVALDPVNFEKPYTESLEGVSTVMKSTPPALNGQARLTKGYPAMTATIVNLPVPALSYANWFSYTTDEFVSVNREIYRSIRITRAHFPHHHLRFVGDAGLDDQKIYHQIALVRGDFIIRACHNRTVEVYNDRLDRWEAELLHDLTASVPMVATVHACFTHAREQREVDVHLGWLTVRLPETQQMLWALVIHDPDEERVIVLLTNIAIANAEDARLVYTEWRHRPKIEHVYRFEQEAGLDIEDVRVRTIERMRRVFVLVLITALFVYHLADTWPQQAVTWLRYVGGKLGLTNDRDGLYVLLQGIRAILVTAATLSFVHHHPFPLDTFTFG